MGREEIEKLQKKKLKAAIKRAERIPFLRERLREKRIGEISALSDVSKLPFTIKKDLVNAFPYGALAVPLERVVRIHTSSGSTNKPVTSFYTKKDLETWSELMARGLACAGARRGDIFQNTTSQGFFTGGLGLIQGAEKLGLTVVPLGSANPEKQLEVMA
ncbi:MAG: phenylacetate--CoA ligase, partial [Candidatus Methanosuratincola petrocarbonis]